MTDRSPFSDRLSDSMEKALREALDQQGGGMVTGYSAIVTYINADGRPCWAFAAPDGQGQFTTLGLLRFATIGVEQQVQDGLSQPTRPADE